MQEARDHMDRKQFRAAIAHLRDHATPCASKAVEEAMSLTVQAMCWTKMKYLDKAAQVPKSPDNDDSEMFTLF